MTSKEGKRKKFPLKTLDRNLKINLYKKQNNKNICSVHFILRKGNLKMKMIKYTFMQNIFNLVSHFHG